MKNNVKNTFTEGLVTDLHNSIAKPTTIVDANNIQFTTRSDNQVIVQKMDGVEEVVDGYPDNLTPLAVKEHNDVLYMVGYDKTTNLTEIGTYPSADYTKSTGKDVGKSQLAYTSNLGTVWHGDLPTTLQIQLNNSNTFTLTNNMVTTAAVRVTGTTEVISGTFTLEAGQSRTVTVLSGSFSGQVGNITVTLTGLPEFGISDQVLSTSTFSSITTSGVTRPPLDDTVTVSPTIITGTAETEVTVTNNSGRVIEVEIQAGVNVSYWPNIPSNEFLVDSGTSDNRILLQAQNTVTSYVYIVVKDSYGEIAYKRITLN